MDHDSVLEALEIAAAEPGGLDRLAAGDTPTAIAVAGHLAGCTACTLELERLRRVHDLAREVIVTTPAPELRERTLARVRSEGVPRGASATGPSAVTPFPEAPGRTAPARPPDRRRSVLGWVAAVAAAVLISVVATSFLVSAQVGDRLAAQDQAIEDLASVTTSTLKVMAQPDAERVALVSPTGADTSGTLLYSPSTTELVVVATGLTDPGPGKEYRCWVSSGGQRLPIGKMFFGGGLAYWVGPSPAVADLPEGETFGVSLVDAAGATLEPDPVLASGT